MSCILLFVSLFFFATFFNIKRIFSNVTSFLPRILAARQHIKKQKHSLTTKVCIVKAMVFLIVIYGCESWTTKNTECWRTDAFELWCWRRLLRVPWTTRRSNQSILKEISLEYSLEGLMLNLKLQYFGGLMQRTDSLENTLMLGKIEGGRRRGWHRMDGWMAAAAAAKSL